MLKNWQVIFPGALLLVSATKDVDAVEDHHYYYFKEPISLRAAVNMYGIKAPADEEAETTRRFLSEAGLEATRSQEFRRPQFSAWRISEGSELIGASPDEVISHLRSKDRANDYFFTPVFNAPFGGYLMPTPSFLVLIDSRGMPGALVSLTALASEIGATVDELPYLDHLYKVTSKHLSGIEILETANSVAQDERVIAAIPNFRFTGWGSHLPNDPLFDQSWGRHNTGQSGGVPDLDVDAPEAWDVETGDSSVVVAVIDVGVQQSHPDLNLVPGADVTDQGPGDGDIVAPCDHHGTAVAGMVSSLIDNSLGTAGGAPGVKVASIRAFISNDNCDGGWQGSEDEALAALDAAESLGADITVNSNFYNFSDPMIESKYQELRDKGMVHFASAGNAFVNQINYPARIEGVNAITGIYRDGQRYGNYGLEAALTGPAVDIVTTDVTGSDGYVSGDYLITTGTSFSTPLVGAVAALLRSRASNLSSSEVELFLESSATDLGPSGWDEEYGWGLVRAYDALALIDIFADDLETGDTSRWDTVVP